METSKMRFKRDERRFERFPCNLRMTYTILSSSDSTPYEYGVANARNLSEAGVLIFTEQDISAPVLMQLNINLPVRPFHMLVLGKALRSESQTENGLFEIGIKFVGILPPEFKRLLQQISPLLKDDETKEAK